MKNNNEINLKNGILFIIVGPSGSGKTTLAKYIIEEFKEKISMIPTYTTRPIRKNEIDKIDYNFISIDEFKNLDKNNFFTETVIIDNNFYGTSNEFLNRLKNGENLLLILNFDGLISWKNKYPNIKSIWIDCEFSLLKERLEKRENGNIEFINKRLKNVEEEKIKIFNYTKENNSIFNFEIENINLNESKNKIFNFISNNN